MIKRIGSFFLALITLFSSVPFIPLQAEAAPITGFAYGIDDYDRNTIKVTGYIGELSVGEDLIIPSQIDGMTVTCVEGTFGKKGGNYGTFILPDTVETLNDLHVHGFSGTLEIPGSVKAGGDDICFYGPEKLIYNPVVTQISTDNIFLCSEYNNSEPWYGWTDYSTPLKEIVLGDNVEQVWMESFGTSAEIVRVSDGVKYICPGFTAVHMVLPGERTVKTDTVFYLKKFDAPEVRWIDDDTHVNMGYFGETGKILSERALAMGLQNCRYYYTNKNEDLPIEQIFFSNATGFLAFESFGLYVGWSGTFEVCVCPLNTTDPSKVQWTSSNPTVATVEDGVVTAHKIGRTTITASVAGKTISQDVYVRNIYINHTDEGVSADNLAGNMALPTDKIDPVKTVVLELDANKLDPSDWTQWGQLKHALEEVYKNIDCTDAFDIEVKLKNNNSTWKIQPLEGKKISVWMPIEDFEDISKSHLIHVKDDGTYEELVFTPESIQGVSGIRFETGSFSSFLFVQGDTPAQIIQQPKNAFAAIGKTAKVSVGAIGDGLKYEWYFKDSGAAKFTKTTSYTGPTYSLPMNEARNGRSVYCVVSDMYGNKVQTETVHLRIAASFTAQPVSVTVPSGATAKVSVQAVGEGLTYQWYYKNVGSSKFSLSTSFKGSSYSVSMESGRNGRQIYCVITDKYGNTATSNVATLSMEMPISITAQPKTTYTQQGTIAKTTVSATGDGLTYTWYIKNAGSSTWNKSSITTNTYSVKMSSAAKDRQIYCVVKDKHGNKVETNKVYLRMATTVTAQPKTTYTQQGAIAKTTVSATGDGLTYTWYIKNAGSSTWNKSSITTNTYSVKMSSAAKNRLVYCVVKDKYGNKVETNKVYLRMAATITKQPASVTVSNGTTAKTSVTAVGDGLTYTWYIKSAGSSTWYKSSITGNTYSVKMSASSNGRQVYCVVTDKYGNTVKSAIATLKKS